MKARALVLTLALALTLVLVGLALADNSLEVPRRVLSGGASDSAAGDLGLRATLGQPMVGIVSASATDVTLGQGFWRGTSRRAGRSGRATFLSSAQVATMPECV